MVIKNYGFNKSDLDLPDSYTVTIITPSGRKIEFDCASHKLVDKVYEIVPVFNEKNELVGEKADFKGAMPIPFFEFYTTNNEMKDIPLSSVEEITFDHIYSQKVESYNQKKIEEIGKNNQSKKE